MGLEECDDLQPQAARTEHAARTDKAPTRMLTTEFEEMHSPFLVVFPKSALWRKEFPRLDSTEQVSVKRAVLDAPEPGLSVQETNPGFARPISFLRTLAYSAAGTPP